MNDFAARLRSHVASAIKHGASVVTFDLGAPVSEEEIRTVHERLGFELDDAFLEYFRACNGWTLKWVDKPELDPAQAQKCYDKYRSSGGIFGAFEVPSLAEIFTVEPSNLALEGDSAIQLPLLGGRNDATFRKQLRFMSPLDTEYYSYILVFADEELRDPVCIHADDNGAELADRRPVRARTFFEWNLAKLAYNDTPSDLFQNFGHEGDHPIVDIEPSQFPENLYYVTSDANGSATDYAMDTLSFLEHQVGTRTDDPSMPRPTRRYEMAYAPKPRTKLIKLQGAVQALDVFDALEEGNGWATFTYKATGPEESNTVAMLRLTLPYGKKSPKALLTQAPGFPPELALAVHKALVSFGLTPNEKWGDLPCLPATSDS